MRSIILFLFLLTAIPAWAQDTPSVQATVPDHPVLIRDIRIDGFVLGDKSRFTKLFKPYRDKYLTKADMDNILAQIEIMYEREGYQQLVSISYQVTKRRLVYTVLMTS